MLKLTKLTRWTLEIEKVGGIWQDTDEAYADSAKTQGSRLHSVRRVLGSKSTPHHLIPAAFSVKPPSLTWLDECYQLLTSPLHKP